MRKCPKPVNDTYMNLLYAAVLVLAITPAPPRQSYDKQRDVTTFSTGDIHISG